MTSIVDEDDAVVAAAWAVLRGDAPEGTEGVRSAETDDGAEVAYRIEPDADPGTVDDDEVGERGEFPDADAVRWRAPREEVAREVGRRDVAEPGRSTAGESGGNR